MEFLQLFITTIVIVSGVAALAFLNRKYDLGLNDMSYNAGLDGENSSHLSTLLNRKEQEIDNLKERVQVLEKLATDPQAQLKRQIEDL